MRLLNSQMVMLLLVSGLSSVATLLLCIFYVHAAGLPGRAGGTLPRVLSVTASGQAQTIFLAEKAELGKSEEFSGDLWWDQMGQSQSKQCSKRSERKKPISDLMRSTECYSGLAVFFLFGNIVSMLLAVVCDLVWHTIHYCRPEWSMNPFLRNLSLGVLVLNIFYNKQMHQLVGMDKPFTTSCVVLCVESSLYRLVEYFLHRKLRAVEYESRQLDKLKRKYTYTLQDEALRKYPVVNRYQLLSAPFSSTFFLFVCQLTLGLFYIYSLNNRRGGWQDVSGWRWFVGLCLCNLAGEEEVGSSFQMTFWLKLLDKGDLTNKWTRIFFVVPVKWRYVITFRMIMSMCVNMFIRRIIFCTAPVLLGVVDEPLDFIKDCLAVFFITKLDDLDDAIEFSKDLDKVEQEVDEGLTFRRALFAEDDEDRVDEVMATKEDLEKLREELRQEFRREIPQTA